MKPHQEPSERAALLRSHFFKAALVILEDETGMFACVSVFVLVNLCRMSDKRDSNVCVCVCVWVGGGSCGRVLKF